MTLEKIKLSASKIKTFEGCSWQYYAKYVLKLPDEPNSGAARGTVSHTVFEVLLNQKHTDEFKKIIDSNDINASKSVARLIEKKAKELNVASQEHIQLIHSMVLTGLKHDFLCNGAERVVAEEEFRLDGDTFIINGFIDKMATYNKNRIDVWDYKSSKAKFNTKEINYNLQNLMYSLACRKIHGVIPQVMFLFLRFPKSPIQAAPVCSDVILDGFENYLRYVGDVMKRFSLKIATKKLAYEDITKKWMCGRNRFKGERSEDGALVWGCPFKFPFSYYALVKDDKVIKTSMENDLIPKDGEQVKTMKYKGCPAFEKLANKYPLAHIGGQF